MKYIKLKDYSINSLILILEQKQKDLERLKVNANNSAVSKEIEELSAFLMLYKGVVIKKILDTNISIKDCCHKILKTTGLKEEIYEEVFVSSIIMKDEFIDVDMLEKVINKLSIEHIFTIMNTKKDSVYSKLADIRFNKLMYEVNEDVYEEFVKKIRMDKREGS